MIVCTKRKKLIEALKETNSSAYSAYEKALYVHDYISNFFRFSGIFPLTGVSRINLYSVFAELSMRNLSSHGRACLVIASGIATDDNNKTLFEHLISSHRLSNVWDFENREDIFPDIDSRYKFCIWGALGKDIKQPSADLAFYLTNVDQLTETGRHFTLSIDDLRLINPDTRTCPTFRNSREAELAKAIYNRVPAWTLHTSSHGWPGLLKTPFNMSNDSGLFLTERDLEERGGIFDPYGCIVTANSTYLPLYESKLIHQYNHRYTTFVGLSREDTEQGKSFEIPIERLADAWNVVKARYWLDGRIQKERFPGNWFLVYRMITNATNERTVIATIIPARPCSHSLSLVDNVDASNALLLCSTMNSLVFDYCACQKTPGTNLNHWILKQLPVLPPENYMPDLFAFIRPHVLELTYTAWDLQPFAKDCGYDGPPFRWDEERRFLLRCELDAAYFRLYGIERDDVDYIMETFPIVKRKDEKQYGEYRTKRVILEIYDEIQRAIETGVAYETRLVPGPADVAVAHEDK